jgi:hypothetical protein
MSRERVSEFMSEIGIMTCHGCGRGFSFNLRLVPVVQFEDGHEGPICRPCLELSNEALKKKGLPLLYFLPGAYEPGE